jgi:glycosyltransferase involved in cell wall biosynthesis
MKNIMFFDPALSGHHSEYIRHMIYYLAGRRNGDNYYFVLNPLFSVTFADIINSLEGYQNIQVIGLSQLEYDSIYAAKGLVKRSFTEFKVMDRYATDLEINQCVLLCFNTLQLAVALYRPKYLLHGILFGQFTWQVFPDTISGRLHKRRKAFQTKLLLRNKRLKSVFLLNDKESCRQLNERYKTDIFKYLPDPLPEMLPDPDFNLRLYYGIADDRKIYLHIGTLQDRKGTLEIIDAIDHLSEEVGSHAAIIIKGRVLPEFDVQVNEKLTGLANKFGALVVYENGFVPDRVLKSMLEQSDYILIPYKNAESSSGILGHAINNKKLVIGPGTGLLGHLIKENRLGYLLKDISGEAIATAMTTLYYNGAAGVNNTERASGYIKENTIEAFAKTLMNEL